MSKILVNDIVVLQQLDDLKVGLAYKLGYSVTPVDVDNPMVSFSVKPGSEDVLNVYRNTLTCLKQGSGFIIGLSDDGNCVKEFEVVCRNYTSAELNQMTEDTMSQLTAAQRFIVEDLDNQQTRNVQELLSVTRTSCENILRFAEDSVKMLTNVRDGVDEIIKDLTDQSLKDIMDSLEGVLLEISKAKNESINELIRNGVIIQDELIAKNDELIIQMTAYEKTLEVLIESYYQGILLRLEVEEDNSIAAVNGAKEEAINAVADFYNDLIFMSTSKIMVECKASGILEGTPIVDGIQTKIGDIVLVDDQLDLKVNGLYEIMSTGKWERGELYNELYEINLKFVFIKHGDVFVSKTFFLKAVDSNAMIGDTDINVVPYDLGMEEAPNDGEFYVRKNEIWQKMPLGTKDQAGAVIPGYGIDKTMTGEIAIDQHVDLSVQRISLTREKAVFDEEVMTKKEVVEMMNDIISKTTVRVFTIEKLTGTPIIDGIQTEIGNYVLVGDTTPKPENGVFEIMEDGTWKRPLPFDTPLELLDAIVLVTEGNENAGKKYTINISNKGIVDSDPIRIIELRIGTGVFDAPMDSRRYIRKDASWEFLDFEKKADLTYTNEQDLKKVDKIGLQIPDNIDVDSITEPGKYRTFNPKSLLNFPFEKPFTMTVEQSSSNGTAMQIATCDETGTIKLRGLSNGLWSAWLEVSTKDQVDLKANHSVTITAGAGLFGGGDLSGNRIIGIVSKTSGIIINENDIELNLVNDLITGGTDKALSAEQGKILKKLLDALAGGGTFRLLRASEATTESGYAGILNAGVQAITVGKQLFNFTLYLDGVRIEKDRYTVQLNAGLITLNEVYSEDYDVMWAIEDRLPFHIAFCFPTISLLLSSTNDLKNRIKPDDVIKILGESDSDDGGHYLVKASTTMGYNGVELLPGMFLNEIPNTKISEIRAIAEQSRNSLVSKLEKGAYTGTAETLNNDKAEKTISISTRNGIKGGGNLTSDRMLELTPATSATIGGIKVKSVGAAVTYDGATGDLSIPVMYKQYRSNADLGLPSTPITVQQILDSMPTYSDYCAPVVKTSITNLPSDYGTLSIKKCSSEQVFIDYVADTGLIGEQGKWYANSYKGTFIDWMKIGEQSKSWKTKDNYLSQNLNANNIFENGEYHLTTTSQTSKPPIKLGSNFFLSCRMHQETMNGYGVQIAYNYYANDPAGTMAYRSYDGTTKAWSSWETIASLKHVDSKLDRIGTEIPASSNLNTYKKCGHYTCPSNATAETITNAPWASAFTLIVDSIQGDSSLYFTQTATIFSSGSVRMRATSDGGNTWSAWQENAWLSYVNSEDSKKASLTGANFTGMIGVPLNSGLNLNPTNSGQGWHICEESTSGSILFKKTQSGLYENTPITFKNDGSINVNGELISNATVNKEAMAGVKYGANDLMYQYNNSLTQGIYSAVPGKASMNIFERIKSTGKINCNFDTNKNSPIWTDLTCPSYFGNNGWCKFANGLTMQWGSIIINTDRPTINYPIAFTNGPKYIGFTQINATTNTLDRATPVCLLYGGNNDNTRFQINNVVLQVAVQWFAIGY